jgi:nicotinamidase-related amidase
MTNAKLNRDSSILVLVDIQEGFRKAIPDFESIVSAASTLVQGARALEVPIVVTEQYPKGLGATVDEIAAHLPAELDPLPKTRFSAAAADGFDLGGREQAIVCGIEAHVCVNQTVLDLLGRGVEVHVVADAVGSRDPANRDLGLHKAERAGAWVTSVETALFELLGEAGSDEFKSVQRLVLEHAP